MSLFYLLNVIKLGYKHNLKNICVNNICIDYLNILRSLEFYGFIESFSLKSNIDLNVNNNSICIFINLRYINGNPPFLNFKIFSKDKRLCNIKYKKLYLLSSKYNNCYFFLCSNFKFSTFNLNLKYLLHVELLKKKQGGILYFCIW